MSLKVQKESFRGGYTGKLLRVNLTNGATQVEPLDQQLARDYVGGRGLFSKILSDEVSPQVEPLSPENKLIFGTGPLTATAAPTGARWVAVCKSPLTGAIGCANSGGYFGPELKFAGYDALIVEGKAKSPVYLWIKNEQVEIRSAEHVWGKPVHETEDALKVETDSDAKVACIGPAGENLSRISAIMNDKHRAAGRCGVGAVMGSKNLKAVVARGSSSVRVADGVAFKEAVFAVLAKIAAADATASMLPTYGTAGLVNVINAHGLFPTHNFQEGVFDHANDISGEAIREKVLVRNKGCFACSIACGRSSKVSDPEFRGHGEGPEYENSWGLGGTTGVSDLNAVTKANYLCNELGLDPISAGSTIACAMELNERGLLSKEKLGNLDLTFGSAHGMVEAVKAIAYRQGLGDELAEGSYRFAEKYGHPELSISVKKQELAAYDPRGAKGMGLTYATSNRGACHLKSYTIAPEILGAPEPIDPLTEEGKAQWVKTMQDAVSTVDSTGMCLFITFAMTLEDVVPLLKAATGFDYTLEELVRIGERIWNLERIYNNNAGLTRKDDSLPPRLTGEPMPAGAAKGQVVNLEKMLAEWYQLRGWDQEGNPSPDKLAELGLAAG